MKFGLPNIKSWNPSHFIVLAFVWYVYKTDGGIQGLGAFAQFTLSEITGALTALVGLIN